MQVEESNAQETAKAAQNAALPKEDVTSLNTEIDQVKQNFGSFGTSLTSFWGSVRKQVRLVPELYQAPLSIKRRERLRIPPHRKSSKRVLMPLARISLRILKRPKKSTVGRGKRLPNWVNN